MKTKEYQQLKNAISLHQAGNILEAERLYLEILQVRPQDPDANHNLGSILASKQRLTEAIKLFKRSIDSNPSVEQFWISYINSLIVDGQFDRVSKTIKKAKRKSVSSEVLEKLQSTLVLAKTDNVSKPIPSKIDIQKLTKYYEKGNYSDAMALALSITENFPNHAFSWSVLGALLSQKNRNSEALKVNQIAVRLNPRDAAAQLNLGSCFQDLDKFSEAEQCYQSAISLNPNFGEAYYNLGNLLKIIRRTDEAVKNLKRAIELSSENPQIHLNVGILLKDIDSEQAEYHLRTAISLDSRYAEAYRSLGSLLAKQEKLVSALKYYERAFTLNPDLSDMLGEIIYLRQRLCLWDRFDQDISDLKIKIREGESTDTPPFLLHAVIDDPKIIKKGTELHANRRYPQSTALPNISSYQNHTKIRIGYYSPDFRNHPVTTVIGDLFKFHDRKNFEIHAFSFGPDVKDEWNKRVKDGVDFFHEVQAQSDIDVAVLSRSLEIDIAIDLTGFTRLNRTSIFAYGAAPVQVGYIGFLGTMGLKYYDYIISDKIMIPEEYEDCYAENIIYLPSYQVNSVQMFLPDSSSNKQCFGIPEDVFVFCCFNNSYKITPCEFDSWARILTQVDGSVLVLYVKNEESKSNLEKEMVARGIAPNRLIFGNRLTGSEYWSRYQAVDLFLDTFLYSGCATSSDALRMGCPVLTYMGKTFSSRFGGSLLTTLEIPELITESIAEYEARAIYLATHPKSLEAIREKLVSNILTKPLYDTEIFASSLELAFMEIQANSLEAQEMCNICVER